MILPVNPRRFVSRVAWMAPVALMLLLCQCASSGISTPPEGVSDVENTWRQARIYLPDGAGGVRHLRMDDPEVGTWGEGQWTLPLILYMHGCAGLHGGDEKAITYVAEQGFLVIAPDSFARRSRPLQCDPRTQTGGHNLFVYDFRQAEINYAVQQLRGLSWLKADKMVLFGVSEGGVAAATYRGDVFDGRIITLWTCHGGPLVAGLAAPRDEPVLSIVQAEDPWYAEGRARKQDGDCGAFFDGRPNATSLVLNDGEQHNIFDSSRAREAIAAFLAGVLNAP